MRSFTSIAIAVVIVAFLVIGVVLPASAEVVVSAKGGLFWMEKDKYTTHDTGTNYGFSIQYLPPVENRIFDVGAEYMTGRTRREATRGCGQLICEQQPLAGGNNVSLNMRYDAIIGTVHYRPPISTSIQPYIGGGLGMYIFTPYVTPATNVTFPLNPPTQTRSGWNFDIGTDFRLGPHWIVGIEYRYISANVSSSQNTSMNSWVNNLNFMTTTAAVRYAF